MKFQRNLDAMGRHVCAVADCRKILPWNAKAPVCRKHGEEIGKIYPPRIPPPDGDWMNRWIERRSRRPAAAGTPSDRHVVYYVRIGEYVKIGTTGNLPQRLRQLRVSPDDLLAVEPGSVGVERARHHQFRSDRLHVRRENFHPSVALMEHIARLGGRESVPEWAKVPDKDTLRHVAQIEDRAVG